MNRRNLLKTLSLTLGASVVTTNVLGKISEDTFIFDGAPERDYKPIGRTITAVTIGAGSRGTVYGKYALSRPNELKIVGVADPNQYRNDKYAKDHNIVKENRFQTWEDVFRRPKFADAIIISTPDNLHYGPCMKALEMGYDILLEKPIAPTEKECRDILKMAQKTGRIVAVCHVLRYAPYFVKMKELVSKGAIGEIVSVQHLEPIEHLHMAHAYVRGNWHNSKTSTPIIMAKSCHDLDIVRWIVDKPSKHIAAMGDLKWFRKENAPAGSTARCIDGCTVEKECPYSALKHYYRKRIRIRHLDVPTEGITKEEQGNIILEKLKTTNYGRCVYKMDNDQPDHYVTSIQFDNSVTASLSMEAFTSYGGRRTRVMGAMGDLVGDMNELVYTDFKTGKRTIFKPKAEDIEEYKDAGHGGGDMLMVRDFVQAVANQDKSILSSDISVSVESHMMAFMAEKSRKSKKILAIKL
ncbi:oxidoreductase domain protein [Pseudopedobacter saltans DSM 12145]|uniref:Oxidoreductase domain protein n=1 Tax=Pseudopedobacter saltans (strain ATCC 51119 / DSM 12145 / JCM 21818 / CCUG 39354 / LMG 10337 / NBRC 100064 / NCIMB 13643) TaxID=762903 RepID=F0SCS6_PSESL|nr:Gfo/Idh/MocA family oxidoreductase [Pseudopedobacter saltans]ADY50665.1 oxidoreductase domain protein [Pseudopedobacter saltans DSM 12145]